MRNLSQNVIALIICLLSACTAVDAAGPTRHVVIAFDDAISTDAYRAYLGNSRDKILQRISRLIERADSLPVGEADYVTAIGFVADTYAPDLGSGFAAPLTGDGRALSWLGGREFPSMFETGDKWYAQVYEQRRSNVKGDFYSLLTGAKEYTVGAARPPRDGLKANRLLIVQVTDNHYNGNDDYQKEFADFKKMGARTSADAFFDYRDRFYQNYRIKLLAADTLLRGAQNPYQLRLYEVMAGTAMSLQAGVDYPASLGLERVRGGYRIDFTASATTPDYDIDSLSLEVPTIDGRVLAAEITSADDAGGARSRRVELFIPHDAVDPDSIHAILSGWLHQRDDIYDAYVLSPDDASYPRLRTHITLNGRNEAKVFGMRLPDSMWWFYPSDIKMAAFVWEVILLLIVVGAVVFAIYRLNSRSLRYVPGHDEISLRHLELRSYDRADIRPKSKKTKKK